MQRILNDPDNIVDEMLEGFLKAHTDLVEKTEHSRVVKAKGIKTDKVGVVTVPAINLLLSDILEKICVMRWQ